MSTSPSRRSRRRAPRRTAIGSATLLALGALTTGGALATAGAGPAAAAPAAGPVGGPSASAGFDVRQPTTTAARAQLDSAAARVLASPSVAALRSSLGAQGVVDIDPTTLTPRQVARLDGFLTGPSSAPAASVGLDYVRAHAAAFRLSSADLDALVLSRTYVDVSGTTHLSWTQRAGGVPLFGNGLKASVARDGRLINVQGSPVPGLRAPAVPAQLSPAEAISRAKTAEGVAAPAAAPADVATQVLFATSGGARAAFQVIDMSAARPALSVVDAVTGRVLYRESITSDAAAQDETASVFTNYPGAPRGGTQQRVDLTAKGWLPAGSVVLFGNNSHTYSDVNDDNSSDPSEEISPARNGSYSFSQQRFTPGSEPCTANVCTWRPGVPGSWQANRQQTATQNFYFINNYHDHLARAPIGFTEAAGNFQQVNGSGLGKGGDAVQDEPLDGAAIAKGLPDAQHIDNANFATPPDGTAPRMQMYLWHQPGAAYPTQDPFLATSGSDEADIVYHEYTHGLSHRLVVDAGDVPALDSQQGGSMGEAWSDWYALDYLVDEGLIKDTAAPGEVQVGRYVLPGEDFRSESTDCPVGAPARACPGTKAAGPGGYTYGDFGKISPRGPEVHADGEIWAQTLWDLRTALGTTAAESLVTRAMELSPTFPSFLDMRNAIIQADVATANGADLTTIWKVFAHRGMGFFAGTVTGNDVSPVEDFSLPPAAGSPAATISGRVTDSVTGAPVKGAVVAFGGHDSGFPGSYVATTDAAGTYVIRNVLVGTYQDVYSGGAGFDSQVRTVRVTGSGARSGFSLVRDWAAASGGARIAATNGDDSAAYGCGASALIDQALTQGWSTARPASGGKYATVALPTAVDISALGIDPTGTCGDDLVASAGRFRVETSRDGTHFTTAASGTFRPADTGSLVTVPLAAGTGTAVKAVRYTILDNQAQERGVACPGGAEGCPWLDSRELHVVGKQH